MNTELKTCKSCTKPEIEVIFKGTRRVCNDCYNKARRDRYSGVKSNAPVPSEATSMEQQLNILINTINELRIDRSLIEQERLDHRHDISSLEDLVDIGGKAAMQAEALVREKDEEIIRLRGCSISDRQLIDQKSQQLMQREARINTLEQQSISDRTVIEEKDRGLRRKDEEILTLQQNDRTLNDQIRSLIDQKKALEIFKKERDELTDKLRHDLQLVETKYNGQTVLLKMAQDEMKALEEELQTEIQEITAENERKINQLRVEVADIKDEVLMHEKTISQVTLQLKEKDDKILALQTEMQKLKDKDVRYVSTGVPRGLATLPNLAQIFNIKPEYKPDINTPPPTPPKTSSPGRPASFTHQRLPKTRECQDCLKDLPLDQFVKWHKRCRECEN
jgi:hypothetical protein